MTKNTFMANDSINISPTCPACGDTWVMAIPTGEDEIKISCRRCRVSTDHSVRAIVTQREPAELVELALAVRMRAQAIRVMRFGIFCSVVVVIACAWGAYKSHSSLPLAGIPSNMIAIIVGTSAIAYLRGKRP